MTTFIIKLLVLLGYAIFNLTPSEASASADETSKTLIRQKIVTKFANDAETFTRIMFFLDREEKSFGDDNNTMSPVWKTLIAVLESQPLFEKYVNRLVEDTKTAEEDANYKALMLKIWRGILKPSNDQRCISPSLEFKMNLEVNDYTSWGGMAIPWSMIPEQNQDEILKFIGKINDGKSMEAVKLFDSSIKSHGGNAVMVSLAVVSMSYEACNNLNRWWNGEITGYRCAKNLVDSFISISAGFYGGVAGAKRGSSYGPVGTVIGGIAGTLVGRYATMLLVDYFTQKIFGIPKSEALENAYNFFGVPMTASNEEINTKYRVYSLWHHPSKGGKEKDFLEVQIQMGIIKLARGQNAND